MRRTRNNAGFSFVEILACLLVLAVGVTAAVGMVIYGLLLSARAQGKATGMATAMSVSVDPSPLLAVSGNWTSSAGSGEASGYINNFYVVRHETLSNDIVLPQGFTCSTVSVDVYDTFQGHPIASYSTRLLRQNHP